MDFSSISRALESLQRRQPPLSRGVLELTAKLQQLYMQQQGPSSKDNDDAAVSSNNKLLLLDSLNTLLTCQEKNKHGTKIRWEPLAVGLYIATQVLQEQQQQEANKKQKQAGEDGGGVYMEGPRVPTMISSSPSTATSTDTTTSSPSTVLSFGVHLNQEDEQIRLAKMLHTTSLENLEHSEPRIRTLVAKAVGVYAAMPHLKKERLELHTRLVTSIREHILTGRREEEEEKETKAEKVTTTKEEEEELPTAHADDDDDDTVEEEKKLSRSSTGALDDTTGWRALETNWLALAALIQAVGAEYVTEFSLDSSPQQRQLLADCQYSCVEHLNRHVRAAAMMVLEQWIKAAAAAASESGSISLLSDPNSPLRQATVFVLQSGLADNWSQVRMAASVLCRVFWQSLLSLEDKTNLDDLYNKLLPRMCLNRFYLAQGVKLYSHETWHMIFAADAGKDNQEDGGGGGLPVVVKHLGAITRYYVKMCNADNHVVREAACQAIAELACRLPEYDEYREQMRNYVDLLMQALLMCFHDESWPVRDEACLATATLCRAYPEECLPEVSTLWDCWTSQLTDQIWSVREDAAVALGDALRAYGAEFLDKLRDLVNKLLPSAKAQAAMTPAEYKARQNDAAAHTNSQLYSCGSLAPKLRKGGAGRIGCSSCDVNREKSPWEATDGCIYLIRELVIICSPEESATPMSEDELVTLLTELADVCRVRHFPQSDDLRATLWRNLPVMAQVLGKNRFKRRYLDVFMDLLFSNLDSRSASQLSIHAAGQCVEELANLIGMNMFRARLDDYQRDTFDRVLRERAMMPKGPDGASGAEFSPFGPPGLLDNVGKQHPGGTHPGIAGPSAVRPHV